MVEDALRHLAILLMVRIGLAPAVEAPCDAGQLARRAEQEAGAGVAHPAVVVLHRQDRDARRRNRARPSPPAPAGRSWSPARSARSPAPHRHRPGAAASRPPPQAPPGTARPSSSGYAAPSRAASRSRRRAVCSTGPSPWQASTHRACAKRRRDATGVPASWPLRHGVPYLPRLSRSRQRGDRHGRHHRPNVWRSSASCCRPRPRPVANYVPARRSGDLLVVSGQLPMEAGAVRFKGKLGAGVSLEDGQAAARLCAINILAQVQAACGDLERRGRLRAAGRLRRLHAGVHRPPQGGQWRLGPDGGGAGRCRPARPRGGRRASLPLDAAVEVEGMFELALSRSRRDRAAPMQIRTVTRIAEIDAAAWDRLVPADNPFLRHAFLARAGGQRVGRRADRLAAVPPRGRAGGRIVAAAPLYVKSHSYGEYVFDHGWADGYRRAGGSYYPKLQAAVPFTPVPGPRLLAESDAARAALIEGLQAATRQLGLSSLHVTFCTGERGGGAGGGRLPVAAGHPVPLAEPGLRQLRRLARHAEEREAQDGPQGAPAGRRGRRHDRGGPRRRRRRRDCSTSSSPSISPPSTSAGATPTSAATSSGGWAAISRTASC